MRSFSERSTKEYINIYTLCFVCAKKAATMTTATTEEERITRTQFKGMQEYTQTADTHNVYMVGTMRQLCSTVHSFLSIHKYTKTWTSNAHTHTNIHPPSRTEQLYLNLYGFICSCAQCRRRRRHHRPTLATLLLCNATLVRRNTLIYLTYLFAIRCNAIWWNSTDTL